MPDFLHFTQQQKAKKVVLSESTKKILKDEDIIITESDDEQEILNKLSKSKKTVTKIQEGKIVVKQSLNG